MATDDFERGTGIGSNWTAFGWSGWNALTIASSKRAAASTDSDDNASYYNAAGTMTNPSSSITIYQPGSQDSDIGPALIKTGSGAYVSDIYVDDATKLHQFRVNTGGTFTENGTPYTCGRPSSGWTVELYIDPADNHVKTKLNGTVRYDSTNTTYRTAMYPGIYSYLAAGLQAEDWTGEELAGGGPTVGSPVFRGAIHNSLVVR